MRSMTGHGRGEATADGIQFTVEIHSVNRKQLDISLALPREIAALEPAIRQQISTTVSRGRLNVTVATASASPKANVHIDTQLAAAYMRALEKLRRELKAAGEITIETILRAPGVLGTASDAITPDHAADPVAKATGLALDRLVKMREREGRHLAADLRSRIRSLAKSLRRIESLHPAVAARHRDALRQRLSDADLPTPPDDERLLRELAYFADRSDISEELTRLRSHLDQFSSHLADTEPVGRTLDFLAQEISRELNTLGSKANDAEISQCVVACKAEMEKIREQVQNIE